MNEAYALSQACIFNPQPLEIVFCSINRNLSLKKKSKMGAMRSVAILLGAVACGLSIYSLISPFWAVNIQNMGGMQSMGTKALGLWKFCTKSTGQGNVSHHVQYIYVYL